MLTLILGIVILAMTYGAFWHNQPARGRTNQTEHDQRGPPHPETTYPRRHPGKRLLTISLSIGALAAAAQTPLSTNAPGLSSPSTKASATRISQLGSLLEPAPDGIWENGPGEGFCSSAQSLTVAAGATYGTDVFGSRQQHHLAMASLTYGHMLGPVLGKGHWYRGNPEFRLELFTGAQFSPETEWFVGLTPHLRYNLATGTRWVPFLDVGEGVTATGIGPPDLSGTFEFNLQAGTGVHWFLNDNLALSLEARYTHWSCAGIHKPNLGLNGVIGLLGLTCFF